MAPDDRPTGADGQSPAARERGRPSWQEPPGAQYRAAIHDATRLNQLFAILIEHAPLGTTLDRALFALSDLFAADIVALLQPLVPGELAVIGAIGLPEEPRGAPLRPFSMADGMYARLAAGGRTPILVTNGIADPHLDAQLVDLDVETAAFLPVPGSEKALGVLVLARCRPVPFSRSDADLLMAMAYRIGLVLDRSAADDERKRLEARLRQAEKAESLARMAAAVAHHFNNKLTAVLGHLDLALDDLANGQSAVGDIGEAKEATRQAATVGQLMLAYLGVSLHRRQTIDLAGVCRQALPSLTSGLPAGLGLRIALPAQPIPVRSSSADVRQVLANLVVNAAEAMPYGGEIGVSLASTPASDVAASPLLSPGWVPVAERYACLEVADSGSGMDAHTLKNAFDPFFTTKFTGRGLGLPVVLGLVRASDGAVGIETEKGRGTTVRVYLPLEEAPKPEAGIGG